MNPLASLARRAERDEEMDALTLPDARYARVLTDLARINRLTLAARPTLAFVQRAAAKKAGGTLRILDVGFGDGGMLRAIAAWGQSAGVALDLTGIDLNSRSAAVAKAHDAAIATPIGYLTGDYRDLAGQGWDVILSSLVAHHMDDAERGAFLRFMEDEAAVGWLVNDLHRRRLPFVGYPLLATAAMVDPIVRRDGQLSIARSFRRPEWLAMLHKAGIEGAMARRWFPYRLCVERLR